MPSILDRVAAQRYSQVRPQTVQEFFALQLARKLGDSTAARHYLELVAERSEEALLVAYRRAVAVSGPNGIQIARNFHTALQRMNRHAPALEQTRLLSVNAERRTVSVAVFRGQQLEDTEVRHLPQLPEKAEASSASFIRWFTANYSVESAAMEALPTSRKVQRSTIQETVSVVLREEAIPILQVLPSDLIPVFGHPETRSRRQAREVVRAIWPILDDEPCTLDAVALGLYVQTERMFSIAD